MQIHQPRPSVELAVHRSDRAILNVHSDDALRSHGRRSHSGTSPTPQDLLAGVEYLIGGGSGAGWSSGLSRNEVHPAGV